MLDGLLADPAALAAMGRRRPGRSATPTPPRRVARVVEANARPAAAGGGAVTAPRPPAPLDLSAPRPVHVVGIGGAGMSAIATVLAAMGHTVTGSDLQGLAGHRPARRPG